MSLPYLDVNGKKIDDDDDNVDVDFFKKRSQLDLESQNIYESNDLYKISLMQFTGPFPAMAIKGLPDSKSDYDFMSSKGSFHHLDLNNYKYIMDLYSDDSVEEAIIYFGLGSVLKNPMIYSENKKYYFDDRTGKPSLLSEHGSRNRNDRSHAFNYFKKAKPMVQSIKNEIEKLITEDKVQLKQMLLNHFDLISMDRKSKLAHNFNDKYPQIELSGEPITSKTFLGGKAAGSLGENEHTHIVAERRALVAYSCETFGTAIDDYTKRGNEESLVTRFTDANMSKLGVKDIFNE